MTYVPMYCDWLDYVRCKWHQIQQNVSLFIYVYIERHQYTFFVDFLLVRSKFPTISMPQNIIIIILQNEWNTDNQKPTSDTKQ